MLGTEWLLFSLDALDRFSLDATDVFLLLDSGTSTSFGTSFSDNSTIAGFLFNLMNFFLFLKKNFAKIVFLEDNYAQPGLREVVLFFWCGGLNFWVRSSSVFG